MGLAHFYFTQPFFSAFEDLGKTPFRKSGRLIDVGDLRIQMNPPSLRGEGHQ
jgi:hypothetical protein